MSFLHTGVPLTVAQVNAIGRDNGIHRQCFKDGGSEVCLIELAETLDQALAAFPSGAFVRLGSRSPKDTPLALATGCRATTGSGAVALLTAGSRRIAFDLRQCLRFGIEPWLFLRAWAEIDGYAELRCFWREGRLVGVSQYHHRRALPTALRRPLMAQAGPAITHFAPRFRAAWGPGDCVFDIWLTGIAGAPEVILIEINPWGPTTDAGLFAWQDQDFDGSLRIRTHAGVERHTLGQGPSW